MEVKLTREQKRKNLIDAIKFSFFLSFLTFVISMGIIGISYLLGESTLQKEDFFIPFYVFFIFYIASSCLLYYGANEHTKSELIKEQKKEKVENLLYCDTRVYPIRFRSYSTLFETLLNNKEIEFYASIEPEGKKVEITVMLENISPTILFEEINLEDFLEFYEVREEE